MLLSFDSSLRTCKFDSGQANNMYSDRFQNPNNMICIPPNGMNNKGQTVCPDSEYLKSAGCNSALDRVSVESMLRPDYSSRINLNASGISGDIYGNETAWQYAGDANKWESSRNEITGNFGGQFLSTNISSCGMNTYEKAMASMSQKNRQAAAANNGYNQHQYSKQAGGCGR